ncbi:MAG: hypothetical protein HYX74_07400 [Acidobacteria bacterium]|nr:hypothetical protein [Acidobacteriota bacterium]
MKRLLSRGLLVIFLALLSGLFALHVKGTSSRTEAALVEFSENVALLDVILLKGQYLVVHDEDKMAQGEPCTYVYERSAGRPYKLIVSFHCQPVARAKAELFTVTASRVFGSNLYSVQEIQFAGSVEGHRVP